MLADQQANKDDVGPSAPLVQEVRDTDDGVGTSALINTNISVEVRTTRGPNSTDSEAIFKIYIYGTIRIRHFSFKTD